MEITIANVKRLFKQALCENLINICQCEVDRVNFIKGNGYEMMNDLFFHNKITSEILGFIEYALPYVVDSEKNEIHKCR